MTTCCGGRANVRNHDEFPEDGLLATKTEEFERDDTRPAPGSGQSDDRIQGQTEPMPWGEACTNATTIMTPLPHPSLRAPIANTDVIAKHVTLTGTVQMINPADRFEEMKVFVNGMGLFVFLSTLTVEPT